MRQYAAAAAAPTVVKAAPAAAAVPAPMPLACCASFVGALAGASAGRVPAGAGPQPHFQDQLLLLEALLETLGTLPVAVLDEGGDDAKGGALGGLDPAGWPE